MENVKKSFFFHQWHRKLMAFLAAMLLWFFVNHTIVSSKTISSVPIRIVNLPKDHTIIGLLPNGFLNKRITLTLTGTKDVIEQLEPGDIEVVIDVANFPAEGILNISKKNVISLNPSISLYNHLNSVSYPEYILKISPTLTENVLIHVLPPIGDPPQNYDFLDIWPMTFTQKISGPQELVSKIKDEGLEITFNLSEISKETLDKIKPEDNYNDIVNFDIPVDWKKIYIPLPGRSVESINDPESENSYITFLRKKPVKLKNPLPIELFFPLKNLNLISPEEFEIADGQFINIDKGVPFLTVPVFANNVSQLFLEVVQDFIQIEIAAAPKTEREKLKWSIGFINEDHLENTYVAYIYSNSKSRTRNNPIKFQERESYLRQRFRNFVRNFKLTLEGGIKFEVEAVLEKDEVKIHIPNTSVEKPRAAANAS